MWQIYVREGIKHSSQVPWLWIHVAACKSSHNRIYHSMQYFSLRPCSFQLLAAPMCLLKQVILDNTVMSMKPYISDQVSDQIPPPLTQLSNNPVASNPLQLASLHLRSQHQTGQTDAPNKQLMALLFNPLLFWWQMCCKSPCLINQSNFIYTYFISYRLTQFKVTSDNKT